MTPWPVEYARFSQTRGGAPTVVPHSSGNVVKAEILVLSESVSIDEAKSLLWRRETRKERSGRQYRESASPQALLIREVSGLCGVDHVFYTDFNPSGKIQAPDPRELATAAVNSVANAPVGKDGISYLIDLINSGVVTALTARYQKEVLTLTNSATLAEALSAARGKRFCS